MRAKRPWLAVAALAFLATLPLAHAGKMYVWVDANGVKHYSDSPPPAGAKTGGKVSVVRVPGEPSAIARLRVERDDGFDAAIAENTIAGPIEVMVKFGKAENMRGDPELPARAIVPANGTALVSRLFAVMPGEGRASLLMEAVPGDPRAKPQNFDYGLPLPRGKMKIEQGFNGKFSHTDVQNKFAIDFGVPQGTPVYAARAGVVMQVESDFDKAGLDLEKYGGRANYVRILHDDGTMGLYAHLRPEGVLVRAGQRVKTGQQIGLSGNTGFTSGPHLHFAVQVNRGMALVSLPFRMTGVTDGR
jgi:hypothetical protein